MEHKLATAEKKVLVHLVKLVQKRKLAGENGEWKDFLNVYDKRNGASLSDPGRRSNDVLIAFLNTFKKKEDLQLLARVMQCDVNRDLIEKFKEESPDKETPEQRLVRKTIMHPEFATDYAFPSYSDDWLVTEIGKKKTVLKCTRMFAIDCEMVTCDDGTEAVVRVAVVDRDLEQVLHKYVKPDKPVIDYKTDITGVTAEDLEKATLSVADIQRKLRRFLTKGTILVGHSLNKDLAVLKIDHARVIDTSLVFKFSGVADSKRPSLNSLCKSVLGYELRQDNVVHDCVQDAAAAMRLVLAVVEKGAETLVPLPKEMLEAEKKRLEAEKIKLFLHKIPSSVSSEELHSVITGDFTIDVKPAKKEGGFYSAVATFNSREEANRAFEKVNGDVVKDRSGLPQKLAEFTISSGTEASLYVRKMVQDSTTTKRARPEEDNEQEKDEEEETNNARSKRQKREEELENRCEKLSKEIEELKEKLKAKEIVKIEDDDRAKEIEELKQKLNAKDFAIQTQDKMITNLKKKLEMKKKK